jgi:hypothetical protein
MTDSHLSMLLNGIGQWIITPLLVAIVAEWRLSRQRQWQAGLHEENTTRIEKLQTQVQDVGEDAKAAYHTANQVNEWRGQMMDNLQGGQRQIINQQKELTATVKEQLERDHVPLVILPSPDITK